MLDTSKKEMAAIKWQQMIYATNTSTKQIIYKILFVLKKRVQ